jgi:hypothetical protein
MPIDAIKSHQMQTSSEEFAQVADNSAAPATVWRSRPIRLLILCGVLLAAVTIAVTSSLLLTLRNRDLAESESNLKSLVLVLAEQIDRSFQSVELMQTAVIERMQRSRVGTVSAATTMPRSGGRAKANLIAMVGRLPTPLNLCSAFQCFCATGSHDI